MHRLIARMLAAIPHAQALTRGLRHSCSLIAGLWPARGPSRRPSRPHAPGVLALAHSRTRRCRRAPPGCAAQPATAAGFNVADQHGLGRAWCSWEGNAVFGCAALGRDGPGVHSALVVPQLGTWIHWSSIRFSMDLGWREQPQPPVRSRSSPCRRRPVLECRKHVITRAAKELHFNKNMEALKRMQAGADKLATVVGVTIGPKVNWLPLQAALMVPA